MGKKLAFWGDCNGCGYKIIRILEELGGINVSNYAGNEVVLLYHIDKKNHIKGTYSTHLDKEKYVVMTYHDFIAKYPFQVGDIVYSADNHEEGKIVEIVWDETAERMKYLVEFETAVSWMCADEIFSYVPKDNSDCGTAIKPMKVKSNAVKLVDNKVVDNLDEGKTMNKKLAIKGHPTRGKEVIGLLDMMGGKNIYNYRGEIESLYCFIDNNNIIMCDSNFNNNFAYFTLEEFLEKYPFKVGDKVMDGHGNSLTIKSMSWSDDCETMVYDFEETEDVLCAEDMKFMNKNKPLFKAGDVVKLKGCPDENLFWIIMDVIEDGYIFNDGKKYSFDDQHHYEKSNREVINTKPSKMKNVLAELLEHIKTTPKEELEREFEEIEEWSNVGPTVEEFRTFCECVNKKLKYPDNYEECVRIAKNIHGYDIHIDVPAYGELMESFVKLLICRDAYWKIAGEEMGLDKSWEPKFGKYILYSIKFYLYQDSFVLHKGEYSSSDNCILVFPTEEMRDAFYENFKKEIEECKELL